MAGTLARRVELWTAAVARYSERRETKVESKGADAAEN
jgi:hypothetical protein